MHTQTQAHAHPLFPQTHKNIPAVHKACRCRRTWKDRSFRIEGLQGNYPAYILDLVWGANNRFPAVYG